MNKIIKKIVLSMSIMSLFSVSVFASEPAVSKIDGKVDFVQMSEKKVDFSKMAEGKDLQLIIKKSEKYKSKNPNATINDLNNFVISEFLKEENNLNNLSLSITPKATEATDYASLPYLSSMLNDQEKAVFNENPYYGSQALLCGQQAMNWTSNLFTLDQYGYHNDNADAFRHSFWNGSMTMVTTEAYAKKFTDAHEYGATEPNPALEQEMDLYNNAEGRYRGLLVWQNLDGNTAEIANELLANELVRVLKLGNMERHWGLDIGKLTYNVPSNGNGLK